MCLKLILISWILGFATPIVRNVFSMFQTYLCIPGFCMQELQLQGPDISLIRNSYSGMLVNAIARMMSPAEVLRPSANDIANWEWLQQDLHANKATGKWICMYQPFVSWSVLQTPVLYRVPSFCYWWVRRVTVVGSAILRASSSETMQVLPQWLIICATVSTYCSLNGIQKPDIGLCVRLQTYMVTSNCWCTLLRRTGRSQQSTRRVPAACYMDTLLVVVWWGRATNSNNDKCEPPTVQGVGSGRTILPSHGRCPYL